MTAASGFILRGKRYDLATITSVTVRNTLAFNAESAREGWGITWGTVLATMQRAEISSRDPNTVLLDEDWTLLIAAAVWAAQIKAGDVVSASAFGEFSFDDVEWIEAPREPQDRKDPRKPRPASGRGGAKRPVRRTSASPSPAT